jgi:hypothetical protein
MLYASTAEVLLPAVFGAIGTITGALIATAGAFGQRRAELDNELRKKAEAVTFALEELENDPKSSVKAKSVSRALQSLGFAAMAARIDSRLALDWLKPLRQYIANFAATRREAVGADVREYVAELLAAVNEVAYWRRRGRFMPPSMKRQAEEAAMRAEAADSLG